LLIDPDTVRSYFKRYKDGGLDALLRMNYVGSEALLDVPVQPPAKQPSKLPKSSGQT
jgi:hypothetical protein